MIDPFIHSSQGILNSYQNFIDYAFINNKREDYTRILNHKLWKETTDEIIRIKNNTEKSSLNISDKGVVEVSADLENIGILEKLIPWRKGPFSFNNIFIDSEWDSSLKWNRIKPYAKYLEGKNIVDIGSGNGYYAYRMLEHKPRWVLSLDPSVRSKLQFELINAYAQIPNLEFEMLGINTLSGIKNIFDVAFCMGVVYHRSDPIGSLKWIRDSLSSEGTLFLESIVINEEGEYALSPSGRYAKQGNVYFIPTKDALKSWLIKAGFIEIELISFEKTSFEEQRKTKYAPWDSLEDFLDPNNKFKTIEGYPAPYRACYMAKTKRK